jgi:hypothetical protein
LRGISSAARRRLGETFGLGIDRAPVEVLGLEGRGRNENEIERA